MTGIVVSNVARSIHWNLDLTRMVSMACQVRCFTEMPKFGQERSTRQEYV